MDTAPSLPLLLQRPDLWHAGQSNRPGSAGTGRSTGFAALDQALHGHGWPQEGLVELLCTGPTPQVLRLLLPAMAKADEGLVVLAAPPARPHTRTLKRSGLDPARLLVLHGREEDILLRACREAAASGSVALMVAWLAGKTEQPANLRRLHLAARQGRCCLFLVRDARQTANPSPAPLRLQLRPCLPGDLEIRIHKQAGGRAGQRLQLALLPEWLRTPVAPVSQLSAPQQLWRDPAPATTERIMPQYPASGTPALSRHEHPD